MAKRKPKPEEPEPPPTPPPPLTPRPGAEFKRDLKRLKKRGKDMEKLRAVVETLCARGRLEPKHKDHALSGDWKGWRDCHVEPDWLLIYREEAGKLELGRTGTHADLLNDRPAAPARPTEASRPHSAAYVPAAGQNDGCPPSRGRPARGPR